ncbi:NADH-quinone oxidoreductase subunit N [candidate division KSB1 bacterium]|nr:NADH-quinone oxidoreductase subunit N [candidate division KSB1 bacterium]
MEFTSPNIEMSSIYPQIVLTVFACILLLVPLFLNKIKRETLAIIAIAGIIIALWAVINLWDKNVSGFNGTVIADNFSLAFTIVFLVGALLSILLSLNKVENEYLNYGDFYGLLLLSTVGMIMMVSTSNLLVVFLGLEILSIALYILTGIRKMRMDSVEASLKYFLLGAFSTGFFLYGIALVYGATGTLDMVEIGAYIQTQGFNGILLVSGVILLMIGFSFKAAFVPFHMWTPDVYQGAPTPVTAFMSSGAKGAAIAPLIRIIIAGLPLSDSEWISILWVVAVLTMSVGNIVAISQNNIKRMLAYSSIAHAGYLLIGVIAGSDSGQSSVLFYLLVYTFMNLGAFGVISYMGYSNKQENLNVEDYRGLGYRHPFAALAMAIFMFSLAGIPPTGGFVGKFYIFSAAIQSGYVWLVIIGVLNSVISVYYYLRVVINLYMRDAEREIKVPKASLGLSFAILLAMLAVLQMGIMPSGLFEFFQESILVLP